MPFDDAWRWAGSLLILLATPSRAEPPALPPSGSVEIPLTGLDASGARHRLHGELTFSGVDNGVVRSASTREGTASDVLRVELPAGRYTLALTPDFAVGGAGGCSGAKNQPRLAWLDPRRTPLVRVTGGHATRLRFDVVATDARRPSAASPSPRQSGAERGRERPRRGPPSCVS